MMVGHQHKQDDASTSNDAVCGCMDTMIGGAGCCCTTSEPGIIGTKDRGDSVGEDGSGGMNISTSPGIRG